MEHLQRELASEDVCDLVEDANRRQGVAAEVEEQVVVDADVVHTEGAPPDFHEGFVDRISRRHVLRVVGRRAGRQRGAIDLAAPERGQGVEEDHAGRHHRVGQRRAQHVAQRGRGWCRPLGDAECHQAHGTGAAAARRHDGFADAGHAAQRLLHLEQLDAIARDLHLTIGAAGVDEAAVVEHPPQIAGAEHAPAGIERIGREHRGSEIGPPPVAVEEIRAAHHHLTDGARRHRRAGRVADRHVLVGDGPIERQHRIRGRCVT